MAVMTHAPNRTEADYTTLTQAQQDRFDSLMQSADIAGPANYADVMGRIADLVGLPQGEIRKCACSCYCPVIFDGDHADAHVIEESGGYNLGRVQCPTCTDTHRETA
ncbi:hypothetical protein PV402_39710 [Streptomyces scabiei]|uniref:hypothetical protein n=1 Tax=Streptomyces scabiei TaxID=1930 RepID=UPI0029A285BD|nr:hypothetical protein [Streptomyces scabiei]MDX2658315.1 hypothetical protein [Streptomyces scabiei]MDX2870600.1 hypothetical protein [Streptomyces scabiei]